jgi:hypothetical protein
MAPGGERQGPDPVEGNLFEGVFGEGDGNGGSWGLATGFVELARAATAHTI